MIGPRRAWSGWLDGGHLSLDVVVALVDGELAGGPTQRAEAHVDHCLQCAAEVTAQRQARRRLRGATPPSAPTSLLSSLRAIPVSADLPPAPGTLAVDDQGRFVVRADGAEEAAPAGLAGTDHTDDSDRTDRPAADTTTSGARLGRRARRRLAVGLPAAVASGLAVGAVTLAAPAAAPAPPAGTRPASVVPAPTAAATNRGPTALQAEMSLRRTDHADAPTLPGPGSP